MLEKSDTFRGIAVWIVIAIMVVVAGMQIVALRQANYEAEVTDLRFRQAIQGSDQGLWAWEIPADKADWSLSMIWTDDNFKMFIWGDREYPFVFRDFMQAVHHEDRAVVVSAIERTIDTGESFAIDYQIKDGNGRYLWVHARGQLNYIHGKRTLSGSIIDITPLKLEQLRATLIVNSSRTAIIMCDDHRRVIVFNNRAEEMFGWKSEEMIGQPIDRIVPVNLLGKHQNMFTLAIQRFQTIGDDIMIERPGVQTQGMTKDGKLLPIVLDVRSIKYRGRIEFMGVLRPVGEQVLPSTEGPIPLIVTPLDRREIMLNRKEHR